MGCIHDSKTTEMEYDCSQLGEAKTRQAVNSELPETLQPKVVQPTGLSEATLLDQKTVTIEVKTTRNDIKPASRADLAKAALAVSHHAVQKIADKNAKKTAKASQKQQRVVVEPGLVTQAIQQAK